jgi:uncharacterized membrane protein YkoI
MTIIERRIGIAAIALATFAVLVLLGPGSGSGLDTATAQDRNGGKQRAHHHSKGKNWLTANKAAKAVRLAYRSVGNATARPYEIESKYRRGSKHRSLKPVWEVEVAVGDVRPVHVVVNARATKVLNTHRGRADDDAALVQLATVQLAKAIRIAKKQLPKHKWKRSHSRKWMKPIRFDDAGIDRFGDRLVWEVAFDRFLCGDIEVKVDAQSGKVLRVESDRGKFGRHHKGIKRHSKSFC